MSTQKSVNMGQATSRRFTGNSQICTASIRDHADPIDPVRCDLPCVVMMVPRGGEVKQICEINNDNISFDSQ